MQLTIANLLRNRRLDGELRRACVEHVPGSAEPNSVDGS